MEESQIQAQKFRQYHPLQDLNPSIRLYNLPTSPDYLYPDSPLAGDRRSVTENLLYYVGFAYTSGTIFGGVKGALKGLRSAEPGESVKIRLSRVLNCGGIAGRRIGNSIGVMGVMFGGIEGAMSCGRGKDDGLNSVVAGVGSGAICRAVGGVRSAVVGAVVGGVVAGVVVRGKMVLKRFVPLIR